MLASNEIRHKFLRFFSAKGRPVSGGEGHRIVPSSSLVPENDASVLFTTAGMQQFKSYYIGEKKAEDDFGSLNVTSVQKCVRTSDIEEVGDASHLTFFEMLGNFSFGGYGKKEAINYAYEFIKNELGLEISYVTYFKGSNSVGKDEESAKIWSDIGIKDIREEGSDVFWGPTGNTGPCGPTTEIYCKNASGQDVEIWNIVFNQFFCEGSREQLDKGESVLKDLPVLGIDTGMGFERLLTILQKKESVYETDLFEPIINKINDSGLKIKDERAIKIIADHIRTAVFMIADGVRPSNAEGGYILRRLIRRAVVYAHKIGFLYNAIADLTDIIAEVYEGVYPIDAKKIEIKNTLITEIDKFKNTLEKGLKQFDKKFSLTPGVGASLTPGVLPNFLSGEDAFLLFTTYGFPLEMTLELAREKGMEVDVRDFDERFKKHQDESRKGAEHKFKGGLADHDPKTIKLHTAHHLLLAALQEVLGQSIKQRGSNITQERLRIDFAFERKMTDEEKKKVEEIVNQKIKESLEVVHKELPKAEAEKLGAEMEFGAKYGDIVSVYIIGPSTKAQGDASGKAFSIEFCGGPHVWNTSELGANPDGAPKVFKIKKEEAVAAGVRRIKAILE